MLLRMLPASMLVFARTRSQPARRRRACGMTGCASASNLRAEKTDTPQCVLLACHTRLRGDVWQQRAHGRGEHSRVCFALLVDWGAACRAGWGVGEAAPERGCRWQAAGRLALASKEAAEEAHLLLPLLRAVFRSKGFFCFLGEKVAPMRAFLGEQRGRPLCARSQAARGTLSAATSAQCAELRRLCGAQGLTPVREPHKSQPFKRLGLFSTGEACGREPRCAGETQGTPLRRCWAVVEALHTAAGTGNGPSKNAEKQLWDSSE